MSLRDRPTGRRLGLSRNATGDGRGSASWAVVKDVAESQVGGQMRFAC